MRGVLLIAPLLWGCSPEAAIDAGDPAWVEPVSFQFFGAFGYDPELDAAVPYALADNEPLLQPWMELVFEVVDADGEVTDCRIASHTLDEGPVARASWADPDGMAFDVPESAGWSGSCRHWDPAVWGDNPARTLAQTWAWGFGVGPAHEGLRGALAGEVEADTWDEHWEPYLFGGQLFIDSLDAPMRTQGYGFGYAVDDAFVMQYQDAPSDPGLHNVIADAVPIEAADAAEDQLPRGVYLVLGVEAFDVSILVP